VRLLGWAFIILAVLSAACALLLPEYGIDNQLHRGDWQGSFGHKNGLGEAMAMAMIVLWSAKGVLPRVVRIAALPLCAVVMLMSGSRSALLVSIALRLLVPSHCIVRARVTTLVPLAVLSLAAAAAVVFLAVSNSSFLLASLGRDATLTRRTEIWTAVWAAISSHVVLGYGFSGFWAGIHGDSARVAAMLGFVARRAHNGFLDLWLELGIAGLFLFGVGYLQAVGVGVKLLRMSHHRLAAWPLQYLAFLLLYDLVEGLILRQNNLYWAVYAAVVVSAAQAARIGQASMAACPADAGGPLQRHEQQPGYLPRRTAGRVGDVHPGTGRSAA
jgi:O-antigen ligase